MVKSFLKIILLLSLSLFSGASRAQSDGKLIYLRPEIYPVLKKELPPPPAKGSNEEGQEERELFALQKSRTAADCARAASEVEATLGNLYGPPNGPISGKEIEKIDEFFKSLRNEAAYFIGPLKNEYPRKRPYDHLQGLEPCIKRETSNAYPSGHAILAELYALVLIDLFPGKEKDIRTRSTIIGKDRAIAGVHHSSDLAAGRQVGRKMYAELKGSKSFQEAFRKARQTVHP